MTERRLTAEYLADVLEAASGPFEVPAEMLRDAIHDLDAADREIAGLTKSRGAFLQGYEDGCKRWEKLKAWVAGESRKNLTPNSDFDNGMFRAFDDVQDEMAKLEREGGDVAD